MPEKPKIEPVVFKYKDNLKTTFTDIVRVHINMETATLDIGLKDPTGNKAEITEKIVMTMPHFLRLVEVLQTSSKDVLKQIEKIKKEQK